MSPIIAMVRAGQSVRDDAENRPMAQSNGPAGLSRCAAARHLERPTGGVIDEGKNAANLSNS
ncbi:hypothetical protein [Rhodothalassium salexigens]|uniref:hypothetical protein n=1 Tax=Rhodothalassium salexigens TaxID=1086 RepID=UPI001912743D|nr:hypothetical protein [Rhodothalassium salexigens]